MQEDSYEAWMQRVESLTPEEHAETVKVCDAGYFRKYLTAEYDGGICVPTDEVKKLVFEHDFIIIEFVEGTVLQFIPFDNDIDAAKFSLAKKRSGQSLT